MHLQGGVRMYYLNPCNRLKCELVKAAQQYFGKKANVCVDTHGKLMIFVENGYKEFDEPQRDDRHSDEWVVGGGHMDALDGRKFLITITEENGENA